MVVIFDLDDTLIDHTSAMRGAAITLFNSRNAPGTINEFLNAWEHAHRKYYPRFLSGNMTYEATTRARIREAVEERLSNQEADALFEQYLEAYASRWGLFADVVPSLDRLQRLRLGVVSNGRSDEQRRKLVSTGIVDRFERVVISEDCGHAKPSAEIFRHACRKFGVPADEAMYVGDQYELDACAARKAGLRGVWLDRPGNALLTHKGPIVRSLEDVVHLC